MPVVELSRGFLLYVQMAGIDSIQIIYAYVLGA